MDKEHKRLRAQGRALDPVLHIGKEGVTPGIIAQLDRELEARRLVKVRLRASALPEEPGKQDRKALARELADATRSEVIDVVGNVVVLHR